MVRRSNLAVISVLTLLCFISGETSGTAFTSYKERVKGEMITDEDGRALTSTTGNELREAFIKFASENVLI